MALEIIRRADLILDEWLVIEMAMFHDMHEIEDGDVPANNPDDYEEYENKPVEEQVLKAADLIDAWIFIRDNRSGIHAIAASIEARAKVLKIIRVIGRKNPEVRDAIESIMRELQHEQ